MTPLTGKWQWRRNTRKGTDRNQRLHCEQTYRYPTCLLGWDAGDEGDGGEGQVDIGLVGFKPPEHVDAPGEHQEVQV